MSLFRSEVLALALCPDAVGVARRDRSRQLQCEALPIVCGAEPMDCDAAFTVLHAWLRTEKLGAVRTEAAVSARYGRACLVPWTDRRLNAAQDQAWVRLHFEAVYGDMQGWQMRADPGAYAQARLAFALPSTLVTQWHALCREHRLVGAALGPYFLQVWNRWRRRAGPGQLWGVSESDRVFWAEPGVRGWQSVRTMIARAGVVELPTLAAQERQLLGRDGPGTVMLHVPGQVADAPSQADGVSTQWLMLASQQEPASVAMARTMEAT